ncbi:MAG: zinc metalloprotease HtpX [Candidatus Woesearchaeota archaeon]
MNQIRTVLLLGLLSGLLLIVGQLVGGPSGLTIAVILAVAMNFGSYWFSDKIVLKMYKAQKVDERTHPQLYKMVRDVAQRATLPMPKVYVIPSQNPNAFATGRNPKHAAVAFTKGIMDLLDKEELKGVIAHEMSHVRNRDILISSIAATLAAVISYAAMMARWAAIFGGFRDDDNPLEFIVLALMAPIIAFLIQMGISRSREYHADASAKHILNSGEGLASALGKLHSQSKRVPMDFGSESGASLFIVNPFKAKALMNLFSTHPPIDERIRRLRMAH